MEHKRAPRSDGTLLATVLLLVVCCISSAMADEKDSDSCMVRWLQLLPQTRKLEDAQRAERIFKLFFSPADEASVQSGHVSRFQLQSVLAGKAGAKQFVSCLKKESSACSKPAVAPCKNGGRCLYSTQSGYTCECARGFTGHFCDKHGIPEIKEDVKELQESVAEIQTSFHQLKSYVRNTLEGGRRPSSRDECRRNTKSKVGQSGMFVAWTSFGPYTALCDRRTDSGGWTVIQRRVDGSVSFDRPWEDYRVGFRSIRPYGVGDYWLGLETIHRLTSQPGHPYEMRIDMTFRKDGKKHFAKYSHFIVRSASQNYRLHLSGFTSPDLKDSMAGHNNQMFTTKDRDHDTWSSNCAGRFKGGWWYTACHSVNINGLYGKGDGDTTGVTWYTNTHTALSFVEMKIRPKRG